MRQKKRNQALLCREPATGRVCLFATTLEAGEALGCSPQYVSRASREKNVMVFGKWQLEIVRRLYAVKDRDGKYWICRYNPELKRYESINKDGFVTDHMAMAAKDITLGMYGYE